MLRMDSNLCDDFFFGLVEMVALFLLAGRDHVTPNAVKRLLGHAVFSFMRTARIKKRDPLSEAALSCLIAWVVVFPPVKLLHVV